MGYDVRKVFLADQVYKTDAMNLGAVFTDPTGGRWVLALKWDSKTNGINDGYQGALFKSLDTGKYEFASRGTEPKQELYKDLAVADLQMGFNVIPDQMASQRAFFQKARDEIIKNQGDPATDLSAVGDSLGASLVNMLGAENPTLKVDGFNTYGVGNLVPAGNYENITNHVMARDPVSVLPGSFMIGKAYMYNEPDNHAGDTFPALSSHTTRSLWQDPSVVAQAGKPVVIDAFSPLNLDRHVAGAGGIQGDPSTGMLWPGSTDTTSTTPSLSPTTTPAKPADTSQLPPISPTAQDADMGRLNTSGGDNVSSVSDADLSRPATVFNAATALPGYAGEQGVTVQAGDTVGAIAQRYGMDAGEYKAFLQQQYGAGADLNSIVAGRRLPLPADVYERTQGGVNGLDISDAPTKPQTPGDASGILDALTDAFANADASAAAINATYGPGVQVADAGNSLPQDSTSNQAPAQADTAPTAIKTEASEATEAEPASGTTPSAAASLNIGAATAYAQSMLSAVNLLQALESGNTLSAALNAAGLANTLGHTFGSGPVVSQELTGGLTALSSALNLLDNLQHGNTLGALSSSLGAGSWVANAMAEHYTSVALEAITEGSVNLAAESAALQLGAAGNAMSGAVPFVGVALALESGNPVSMMAAAANFIPVYGPLISIGLSLLGSGGLFGGGATPPPPYGEVHFAWSGLDANGQPHTAVRTDANVSGGAATASQIAGQILHSLQTMVEQANAQTLQDHPDTDPSQLLALNTNLLPSVFWDKDQTSLKLPNPDGATSFFVNLAEPDAMSRVVQLLQTNGGIAPQWLVDTQSQRYAQLLHEGAGDAAIERELTAGKSGLTEQAWSQAAAIQGSAGEMADFHEQQFGSLVVHAQDAQVQLTEALKNIDHDAYLERTEWVAASDAQGQAQSLLVIDFNADGVIDTRDVLNLGGNRGQTDAKDAQALNANADLQRNNVQWLDANGDGVLDAKDPAFAAVRRVAANDIDWRKQA